MKQSKMVRFGDFLFRHRDTLPVPFIILTIIILVLAKPSFVGFKANLAILIIGGFVVLSGEAIRIWAVGYSGMTTRSKKLIADRLTTEGPYSIIRNPLYLGNFFITLGFSVIANQIIVIPMVVVYFVFQYYPIVIREEHFLLEKFGDAYKQYTSEVPRFFPLMLKTKKSRYNSRALKGEMWTITGIAAMFIAMIGINLIRLKLL
ncbi:MAG: isoprenylcysteine carboxylmethyltransferase family protein [Deltaproteobacteria bacterium]|nr:isoprenylcysteine carboxylmethyltransferase family protein [Deltaproteobacteria bacterium]MCL5791722.1 isoprenylcysteine carboxylmethyltransferase family protein [Deltaproteobacteria bacterium]